MTYFYNQAVAVKLPRFRIAWVMVAVAIAALDFGAIRACLDSLNRDRGILLFWARPITNVLAVGTLPMANVLAVGTMISQRRPGRGPFGIGFEAFGAMALSFFIALAIGLPCEVVLPYLLLSLGPVMRIMGPNHPFVYTPIAAFLGLVMLGGPQLALAWLVAFSRVDSRSP